MWVSCRQHKVGPSCLSTVVLSVLQPELVTLTPLTRISRIYYNYGHCLFFIILPLPCGSPPLLVLCPFPTLCGVTCFPGLHFISTVNSLYIASVFHLSYGPLNYYNSIPLLHIEDFHNSMLPFVPIVSV